MKTILYLVGLCVVLLADRELAGRECALLHRQAERVPRGGIEGIHLVSNDEAKKLNDANPRRPCDPE